MKKSEQAASTGDIWNE